MSNAKLVKGDEVFNLIGSSVFVNKWKKLAFLTNGFTRLQEPEFVRTWYTIYQEEYEPLIVISWEEDIPVAMMCLAWEKNSRTLTHAGHKNAEYHGWLAKPGSESMFLNETLKLVRQHFSIAQWKWGWIPPGLDVNPFRDLASKDIFSNFEQRPSLIWDLTNTDKLQKTKKNRSLRSKYNRLKKKGDIIFRVITCEKEMAVILKTVSSQCDFRQEAINGVRPFEDNPKKIAFNVNLLKYPGTIHASGLWLDDKLLAFHFGISDNRRVCLGTSSYDPSESKYSPGSLLMVELAEKLVEQGYEILDLTPGTDTYKERYANDTQVLFRPSFYFSDKSIIIARIKHKIINAVLKSLPVFGIDFNTTKNLLDRLKEKSKTFVNIGLFNSIRFVLKGIYSVEKLWVYQINSTGIDIGRPRDSVINFQRYEDLLGYVSRSPWQIRRDLLKEAMEKFGNGESLLSSTRGSDLFWLCWIADSQKSIAIRGFSKLLELDLEGLILYDFYCMDKNLFYQYLERSFEAINNNGKPVHLILDHFIEMPIDELKFLDVNLSKKIYCVRFLWIFKYVKQN